MSIYLHGKCYPLPHNLGKVKINALCTQKLNGRFASTNASYVSCQSPALGTLQLLSNEYEQPCSGVLNAHSKLFSCNFNDICHVKTWNSLYLYDSTHHFTSMSFQSHLIPWLIDSLVTWCSITGSSALTMSNMLLRWSNGYKHVQVAALKM